MNRFEALKHAVKAHAGQVDKCGQPYILHPIAVAMEVDHGAGHGETAVVVALVHDVWENTAYRLGGLTQGQTDALYAITRRACESYAAYIERCAGNRTAAIVKLADLWHNLQPERMMCLPSAEALSLSRRYLKARDRIWEALGYEWWPEGGEG